MNGYYCVENNCNFYNSCPAEIPVPPALKKPFYDVLGRRIESRAEMRMHLFTPRSARLVTKESFTVPDCYGRDCTLYSDSRENYDDSLGIYKGKDIPGLNNVNEGDSIDIHMKFNSYIKDRCNAYEVRDSIYWEFHMQGIAGDLGPTTLFGEINP